MFQTARPPEALLGTYSTKIMASQRLNLQSEQNSGFVCRLQCNKHIPLHFNSKVRVCLKAFGGHIIIVTMQFDLYCTDFIRNVIIV